MPGLRGMLMLNTGVRMMINALMNLHDVALLLGYRVRHILFLTMGRQVWFSGVVPNWFN